jgi:chromosome segregation ATPase
MQMNLQQEEHQNMLIELKEAHENEKKDIDRFEKEHEIQLKAEVVAVDEIINDYQLKLNETGQVKNELLKALQNQQSETKHILEAEKKRYNDLMTKYDDLNAAAAANVNHAELKVTNYILGLMLLLLTSLSKLTRFATLKRQM